MTLTSVGILCLTFAVFCTQCRAYVNLALNKPTWQANQYWPGNQLYHSSNAVDGLKSNLHGKGGQCAISRRQDGPSTFWVNLTSIYSIHDIRIYLRNDNNKLDTPDKLAHRSLGFYIYVSNTTNRSDSYICFHDTNFTKSTLPTVFDISCLIHGQYVIFYNERLPGVKYPEDYSSKAVTDLCEIEVYGCKSGYYGFNCSLSCPYNCSYCNIESGACLQNIPGYEGPQYKFINTHEEPDWQLRFYVAIGTFLATVTVTAVLLALFCLKRKKINVSKQNRTEVPDAVPNKGNEGYLLVDYQE
ncbi:uncharacterized protein LOC134273881 isoform X1 [Saccostrea cucullata]|uniref:uncharacterized protein LOC134273881 isoform X1 n=1 Tax=Saccostrea cuccullata TaxID=36930 RepID=UPI002ED0DBB1